jgi:hypothetical protein
MTDLEAQKPLGFKNTVRNFVTRIRGGQNTPPVQPGNSDHPVVQTETDLEVADLVDVMAKQLVGSMDRIDEANRFNTTIEYSKSRILAATSIHPDVTIQKQWAALTQQFVTAVSLAKRLYFAPVETYSDHTGESIKTVSRQRLAWAVRSYKSWQSYRDLDGLAESSGLRDQIGDDLRLLECTEILGPMLVNLGPLTLSQFISEEPTPERAGDYLNFYGHAAKSHMYTPNYHLLEHNNRFPFNEFPLMSRDRVLRSADIVAAGVFGAPDQINYNKKNHPQTDPEMLDLIKQVFQSFTHKSLSIKEALTNPKALAHQDAIATLATYSDLSDGQQWFMLMAAKVTSQDDLKSFYRLLNTPPTDPELAKPYQEVTKMVENLASQAKNVNRVTIADVPYFTDFSNSEPKEPLTLNSLHREAISVVLRKAHGKDFALDPWLVEGSGIVPPAKLEIHFDPASNCKFEVVYDYQTADDTDPLIFRVAVNTKKETLDWNLLNSPDQSLAMVQDLMQAVLVSTLAVLGEIKKLTYVPLVKDLPPQPTQIKEGGVRKRYQDPVYKLRKEARKSTPQMIDDEFPEMTQNTNSNGNVTHAQVIALPTLEDLEELLQDVLPHHRNSVLEAIHDFNKLSKGDFRNIADPELNKRGYDYRLKAKNGLRVMLQTVENMPGQQIFSISDIVYRANAYQYY